MINEDYHIQRHLLINSAFRTNLNDNTNNFSILVDIPNLNYYHVSVQQLSIPKSFYTIKDGKNTFRVTEDTVTTTVTITPGFYDYGTFMTEVITQMNATLSYTYSMTYSAVTNKFTFTVTGNGGKKPILLWDDGGAGSYAGMWAAFGFKSNSSPSFYISGSDYILISVTTINLPYVRGLSIYSDIVDTSQDSSLLNVLSVQNQIDEGYVYFQNNDVDSTKRAFTKSSYNLFNFQLRDQGNKLVDLNNADWSISLLLSAHPSKQINNPQSITLA